MAGNGGMQKGGMPVRKRKTGIYAVTALLAVIVMLLCLQELWSEPPFCFVAETDGRVEEIRYWPQDEHLYYVLLPSYVKLPDLRLKTGTSIWLDGEKMRDGDTCEQIQLDRPYELWDRRGYLASIIFTQSENMPALYLETSSGNMEYIHQEKGNEEAGQMRLYTADGTLDAAGNVEDLNARGNYTFRGVAKKSYALKLTREEDLLGMGAAKKWILLANNFDQSNIRNKIVLDFARDAGQAYSPACRWVELFLNGEYAGLYLLSERNEVHPQRVALKDGQGALLSGEFRSKLIEEKERFIQTEKGLTLRVHQSTMDERALTQLFQSAENALCAPDGIDPATGRHWTELMDLDSWVRKYLIEEVFGNVDGGRASSYCYVDGGKIYAGPVWDYDFSLSSVHPYREFGDIWFQDSFFDIFYVHANPNNWFYPLYRSEVFRARMKDVYEREFLPLLQNLVDEKIGHYTSQIAQAARINQLFWNAADPGDQAELVRTCLAGRIDFLNRIWLEEQAHVVVSAGYVSRNVEYILSPGSRLPELPVYEEYHWFDAETDQPLEPERQIYQDTRIYLKKEK